MLNVISDEQPAYKPCRLTETPSDLGHDRHKHPKVRQKLHFRRPKMSDGKF